MKRILFGLVLAGVAFGANAADDMKTGFKDLDANGTGSFPAPKSARSPRSAKTSRTLDSNGDGA
jgi:hypothetical protein